MTTHNFDDYRPPQEDKKRGGGGGKKRRRKYVDTSPQGRSDGSKEERMVPDAEFASYYGQPVVKAPPWEWPIAVYLFLGGLAGGSAMTALGAQATGRDELRRNSRITAIAAGGAGSLALIADLGRPERLLNMFRVFKISSPMNMGSWLLGAFGGTAAVASLPEFDNLTKQKFPLPDGLRSFVHSVATPFGVSSGLLGAPLAVYTSVLFGDTSVPAWNEARKHLPWLFVSSASAATGGMAMVTTDPAETGPSRMLAVAGAAGEIAVTKAMEEQMDEVSHEPFRIGKAGTYLKWAERLTIAGGIGAALGGKNRVVAVLSGAALVGASALTRFGVLEAGLDSTKDPKYVIEPQKRRLEQRRDSGVIHDSITTAR